MRFLISIAIAFSALSRVAAQGVQHNVMPVPRAISVATGGLRLDSAFTVAIHGHRDALLERAVIRAISRLEARIAQPMSHLIGGDNATLILAVKSAGHAVPDIDEDESYRLSVTPTRATIEATTVVGAMRGLETLLQLHTTDKDGSYVQAAAIADTPRFRWRGVLIDASRHFMPVDVIQRTLDGMSVVKLNVLHWHLSEDQGFRVESTVFPKLHELGSDGSYYTQQQIRDVVAYAADRGIRVVPEFDMPGHTTAWFVGHPELASASGPYSIERRWGVFRPTMDPTRETTYAFLERFVTEMVTLFPDRSWHIGGDEVDPMQWKTSTTIQQWMIQNNVADLHALQTHFNRRLFEILERHGKQPVGWDEILQADLPAGAVIQSWRGMNGLTEAVKQGRQAILSAPWYLDHMKTSREMYLADVLPAGLSATQQALVLGGEACMWAEYVTAETVESRLWPRLAAVAERFWSPVAVRDVPDMYRRLEVVSRRIEEVGPRHESHTATMVRRIAGGRDAERLQGFLAYARPRGFGGRGTTQLSPLARLADAAWPDPWTDWRMQARAERAVAGDSTAARLLREDFTRMAGFRRMLLEIEPRVPLARDGVLLATAEERLAGIGLEALEYRSRGTSPPTPWRVRADAAVSGADGKTFGLLRPVGVEAVKTLLAR
ncbi:MAG: family 20 glycosylhydrolase [Gemmatimonadales bacterium]